jgi:glutathione S-transferase
MKLLSSVPSPFAGRVRLAIYAKSLPVEIAPADMWLPEGGKAAAYLAINPMGKIPSLVLDDGTVIPESDTIVEFLADAFPEARLRPSDPRDAAVARLLARIVDLYVVPPGSLLIGQLDPARRHAAAVDRAVADLDRGLGWLDARLGEGAYAVGDVVTSADCAMVPHLMFFAAGLGRSLSGRDLIAAHPRLAAYWARMQAEPVAAGLLAEMKGALKETRLGPFMPAD